MELIIGFRWQMTLIIICVVFFLLFRKEVSDFLKEISWIRTRWFELKRIREEIFAKAEEIKKLSKELNKDKQELRKSIRVFIETLHLALSSRHKFPMPEKIINEINKNLNVLTNLAIKNQSEKSEWKIRMDEIQDLLKQEVG